TSKEGSFNPTEVEEFLQEHLPEYMIPSVLISLDAMPLTPNGKVYRQGLPDAKQGSSVEGGIIAPPRTPVEQVLASIWADVLGADEVGIHDNFFKIGGHSILASQLFSRLRDTLQVELPLRILFEAPTVERLADIITRDTVQGKKVQRIAELLISVTGLSDEEVDTRLADVCHIDN